MSAYKLRRVPVSMGGPALVVRSPGGRVVFETKDFDAAKAEIARLNNGGSEVEHFDPCERSEKRQPDGSIHITATKRPVRPFTP